MLTLIAFATLAAQMPADGDQRYLCTGTGSSMRSSDSALVIDRTRARRPIVAVENQPFEAEVGLMLLAGGGRLRPPAAVMPPVRGGDEGWFDLREMEQSGDTVAAKFTVNFANHPRVTFDRATGAIAIDARDWRYQGRCTPTAA